MKKAFKTASARTADFLETHKVAIAGATAATVTFVATVALVRAMDSGYRETVEEFIAEQGLTEKFNLLFIDPADL